MVVQDLELGDADNPVAPGPLEQEVDPVSVKFAKFAQGLLILRASSGWSPTGWRSCPMAVATRRPDTAAPVNG